MKKVLRYLIPNILIFIILILQTNSHAVGNSIISIQDANKTSGLGRGPKLELVDNYSSIFIGYIVDNSLIFDILSNNLSTIFKSKLQVSMEQFKNEKLQALLDFEVQQKDPGWRVYSSTLMRVGLEKSCNSIRFTVIQFWATGTEKDRDSKTISDCINKGNLLLSGGGLAYKKTNSSAYVGIGDFGQSMEEKNRYRALSTIVEAKISKAGRIGKIRSFSYGHRNPLDLAQFGGGGVLLEVESGPRGGDELNKIFFGKNYGWPQVTLGEPYNNDNDYIQVNKYRTHMGYTKPSYFWKQSQTPTAISLDKEKFNCIYVSMLTTEQIMNLCQMDGRIREVYQYRVNSRIRDLISMPDGSLIYSTDKGEILLVKIQK